MDLVYVFKILWRKKWIIIAIPVFSFILSVFLTKDLPKEYKSTAQIATGFTINESPSYFQEDFNIRDASIKFINTIETMKSQLVVNLVSYRLLQHELTNNENKFRNPDNDEHNIIFDFFEENNDTLNSILKNKVETFGLLNSYEPFEKKIIELLKVYKYDYKNLTQNINVSRLSSSDYINVHFISEDPFLSSFVVNTLAKEFIRYNQHLKSSSNSRSLDFYAKLKNQKKLVLDQKNKELEEMKNSNSLGYKSQNRLDLIKDLEMKKDDLNEEITAFKFQLENINSEIDNFNSETQYSNSNIIDIQNKIHDLQKVKNIERDSAEIIDIENTIKILRKELLARANIQNHNIQKITLDELISKKSDLSLNLKIAETNHNNINERIKELKNSAIKIISKESLIETKEKEVEKALDEIIAINKEYSKEQNKNLISSGSFHIIIPGQPSEEPESSKRLFIVGLAGLASFFLSVFTIIFLEYIDVSIKSPNNFKRQTKLKVAGYFNLIEKKQLDLNQILDNDKIFNKEYEIFNRLVRKLRYEIISDAKSHSYLITSTKPFEGKSIIILSLAYSLSLLNKRILIIDTNFKNNSLTQLLLPTGTKIDKIMNAQVKLLTDSNNDSTDQNNTDSIISATFHKNIDLIGSKKVNFSPSEIFSIRDFNTLLRQLNLQYDYIFLEGAALNDYSDSKELTAYVDKVLAVFSAESSINQKDKESIAYLKSLNGKFMGSILNKVKLQDLEF